MYDFKIKKLPKNTSEILIDIPKATIKEEYDKAFLSILGHLQIEGFRKGKVPKALAEKHVKKEAVYEELMHNFLPKIYDEILKKSALRPIISPKMELIKAKEGEDWQIKIVVAEKPAVVLPDYKKLMEDAKAELKKQDIWVPGKNPKIDKESGEMKAKTEQHLMNKILENLLKLTKVEIPDMLIEDEVDKRLSALLTDIQKIGLTVEAYLKSKNLTNDQLKAKFRKEIEDTYKIEFILNELADKENIKVEQEDLEKLFANIQDPKEKEAVKANSYFYASVLRKQKTLDYLMGK